MSKSRFVVGLAMAALGLTASTLDAQIPRNACALLRTPEIQALAGGAKIGDGVPTTDALGSRACQYKWGTGGNVQSGLSYLNVSVTETSKAFPGMSPSLVKQGLLAGAKAGKADTAVIPGVGDAALYESNDPIRVKTTALVKGTMLIVSFESLDARTRKDQVIALLKAAAGRL
jgi:hypothetical protein